MSNQTFINTSLWVSILNCCSFLFTSPCDAGENSDPDRVRTEQADRQIEGVCFAERGPARSLGQVMGP